ncbi:hypothetical protein BTVI_29841 [Pitangus sulphuratus]|nr:hypothetical protein BTVI_29841 [Pitangus sulphuratus]
MGRDTFHQTSAGPAVMAPSGVGFQRKNVPRNFQEKQMAKIPRLVSGSQVEEEEEEEEEEEKEEEEEDDSAFPSSKCLDL